MLTLMIFLTFLGFSPTGSDNNMLGNLSVTINTSATDPTDLITADLVDSSWFQKLFNGTTGILALIGIGGAIIVGLFSKAFDWKIVVIAFFISFVSTFVYFGWSIVQLAQSSGEVWLTAVIATVFVPLTAMFIFSIVEWFGGQE
jgi:hypothetical protein